MKYIEEKIAISAPVKTIWKIWADNYLQNGYDVGKKGFVTDSKRGVKFKILSYKENESLTIVWYSALVKLVYHHIVEPKDIGSLVTCKVQIKGFFSFLIKPLVSKKIRKYLQMSLDKFSKDVKNI